jgi:hypothetical protein
MVFQVVELALESVASGDVVRVHSRDEGSSGFGEALVESNHQSTVWGPSHSNSIVAVCKVREDSRRVIRRTVVEGQEFEIAEGLGEDALDRLFEVSAGLIDRHQHRDLRIAS